VKRVLMVLVGFALLLVGCGGAAAITTLAPATTAPAVATTTTAPTITITTAEATTITTIESDLQTYSEVVATYPTDVTMCDTEASMLPDGSYEVTGGGLYIENSEVKMPWYGMKVTVKERTSVNGKTYEAGTKLTVDAKMQLMPVSSWN